MSDEPRPIDAFEIEVDEDNRSALYTDHSDRLTALFTAAQTFHAVGEGEYLHNHFRAYFASGDLLSYRHGRRPPDGVRRTEARVLRKVADIRDPDEPDTWDDFEGES